MQDKITFNKDGSSNIKEILYFNPEGISMAYKGDSVDDILKALFIALTNEHKNPLGGETDLI